MKQKRVLMIAQSFYEFDARILRQTSVLVANNYNVDIICLNNKNSPKTENIGGVNVYRIMKKFQQDKVGLYIINSLIFLFKALLKSVTLYPKKRPDVVQIHNMPDYLVFSAVFYKVLGIPVILDIHDLTVELFKEKWGEKKFKMLKPILTLSERLSVKFANKVITVSDQCGERLIERGLPKEKLTIVMNVADSDYFKYYQQRKFKKIEEGLRLIYLGTIAERYALHKSIHALKEVTNKIPHTTFKIFGNINTEYGNSLKKLVDELKLTENVIFCTSVPYKDVSSHLNSADMGIIMSQNAQYAQFGLPTKSFEYASVGLPFIIYDLKTFRTVFREESVCYVDHNDINQISQAIINLCFDPERRQKMSINAQLDVNKVSSDIMKQRYFNLIRYLIDRY
ncbi:MAG: glycosyltransferase family 4 protein [Ignavibacteriaceae bacterium]